jgi:glycine dehydrogenase subunit 1
MIAGISGLDFANASLYDGGTALYEAIALAVRSTNRTKILVDKGINPVFLRIVKTYVLNLDIEIIEVNLSDIYSDKDQIASLLNDRTAAVVVQNPNFFGIVEDFEDLFTFAKTKGVVTILVFYPLSLGILKTPGEMKADIAVGEGQSLGLPLSFGGPYLGLMSVDKKFVRKMPGRIVGETTDRNGRKAYVLTLQAREQHIRREKATSNICTNQALCALRAVVFLSLLGKEGFKKTALLNLERAEYLKEGLKKIKGMKVKDGQTFNEFTVVLPTNASDFTNRILDRGYVAGLPASIFFKEMTNYLIISATEKRTESEIDAFVDAAREVLS